jgi:large subunit ribosomal protein L28e
MASPDLLWHCVRNNSSFLRKGRCPNVTFTCEPGNLTGKNSFTASGLANTKTVDIQPASGSALKLTTTSKDPAVARKVGVGRGVKRGA